MRTTCRRIPSSRVPATSAPTFPRSFGLISDSTGPAGIMFCMSNQSYLSLWCTDFPESSILERLGAFLSTAPFSATKPGFTYLAIRAVDAAEAPILEHDLRAMPLDVAGIIELARDHLHNDSSFEVQCHWDLWVFDVATTRWQLKPQAVEIFCHGEDYDHAFWRE